MALACAAVDILPRPDRRLLVYDTQLPRPWLLIHTPGERAGGSIGAGFPNRPFLARVRLLSQPHDATCGRLL